MTSTDLLAIGIIVALALLACALIGYSRMPQRVKLLLYAAIPLRFIGAVAREAIATDAAVYFQWGSDYAERFSRLDFSPLFDPSLWRSAEWTGTNFIAYPTGLVISLIGPSRMAVFFAFGLLSFGGLVAFALAYRRAFPGAPFATYWAWIFLLPSLWFWPSSIGKEALMIIGLGVATLGFAGRRGRPAWLVMVAGLALVCCVRPQVAAVFLFSVVLAYWLDFSAWTPSRMVQGVAMLAVGLAGIWFTMSATLDGEVSIDAVESYIDTNAARNDGSGSSVDGAGADASSVPAAVVNVLFRPFPWDVHNLNMLVSALEIMLLWGLVWLRRDELGAALRGWRSHRMLRFAIPFVALYVVALGMNLSNLGIIARQRVLVFPFLFMVVEAGAQFRRRQGVPAVSARRTSRRRQPFVPA